MALEQGIPHELSYRLPGQLGAIQGCPKNGLPGFWKTDITTHFHRLIDNIRHTGFKTNAGQDTLGCGVSHLHRSNDKIGLVLVFRHLHTGAMGYCRGRGALHNVGFGFYKAGKKTGAHAIRFLSLQSL